MDYRSGARCELCDELASAFCDRCQCHVCAAHDGKPHCRTCAKEAADDAELARFRDAVGTAEREKSPYLFVPNRGGGSAVVELLAWLGRKIFQPAAPPETPFHRRTPEDIRAWRRKAGIRLRS